MSRGPTEGHKVGAMAKMLYRLEDHFDDLADRWQGYFVGWMSLVLRGFFALAGDALNSRNAAY